MSNATSVGKLGLRPVDRKGKRTMWRLLVGVVGSVGTMSVLAGCGVSSTPTAPTAAPATANGFGVIAVGGPSLTSFAACLSESAAASCRGASTVHARNVSVSAATAPSAPLNLIASSSGGAVTLTWAAPSSGDPAVQYTIEAGSAPGLANLANFPTGNALTIFQASGVGAGTYYVRVRAVNAAGTSSASNEAVLVVGPCTAPGAPSGLTLTFNAGGVVTFIWTAATGSPTSYTVEAGSAPGLSNLANADLGTPAAALTATGVGAGTYYVRVRAKNACGISGPSNEVSLVVAPPAPRTDTFAFTLPAGSQSPAIVGPVNAGNGPVTVTLTYSNGTGPIGTRFIILACAGTASACTVFGGVSPSSYTFNIPGDYPAGPTQASVYFNTNLAQPPGNASGAISFTYSPR